MKFTVGELAKIFNISSQSIHSYVEMGILPCVREENGYRYFDEYSFQKLGSIIKNRNIGIPLKECDFLYNNADELQIINRLYEQKKEITKKIYQLSQQQNQLDHEIELLQRAVTQKNIGRIIEVNDIYRLNLKNISNIKNLIKEDLPTISKWYSNIFYTSSSVKFIFNKNHIENIEYGFITSKYNFNNLIDTINEHVEVIHKGTYISIMTSYTNEISIKWIEGLIQEALRNNNQYKLNAYPFSRLIASFSDFNHNKVNIIELLIPVELVK